jgi:hypothetical protein
MKRIRKAKTLRHQTIKLIRVKLDDREILMTSQAYRRLTGKRR